MVSRFICTNRLSIVFLCLNSFVSIPSSLDVNSYLPTYLQNTTTDIDLGSLDLPTYPSSYLFLVQTREARPP